MALGLASRSKGVVLPSFFAAYAGDTLWALLVFWLVRFLKPTALTWQSACFALAFAFCIEFSQLYQAPWINAIRASTLGGLVLGFGFLFSDLVCYTVGVGVGYLLEKLLLKRLLCNR